MMRRMRAVIIDDMMPARERVIRYLAREPDIEIAGEAENGEEALTKLRAHRYGTVVLDLMMPIVSGFEVVRYLNSRDDAGKPCVIILSAAAERDLKTVESPAIHAVIRKPFELPALVAAVRECSAHWEHAEQ